MPARKKAPERATVIEKIDIGGSAYLVTIGRCIGIIVRKQDVDFWDLMAGDVVHFKVDLVKKVRRSEELPDPDGHPPMDRPL